MEREERIQSLKIEVKSWEYKFQKEHGRPPTRQDIKDTPSIAHKYKEYHSFKSKQSKSKKPKELKTNSEELSQKSLATPTKSRPEYDSGHKQNAAQKELSTPSSSKVTKKLISEVGPTPQLNGRVLGIFDIQASPIRMMKPGIVDNTVVLNTPEKIRSLDVELVYKTPTKTPTSGRTNRQLSFSVNGEVILDESGPVPESSDLDTPAYFKRPRIEAPEITSPSNTRKAYKPLSSIFEELRRIRDDVYQDDEEALAEIEAEQFQNDQSQQPQLVHASLGEVQERSDEINSQQKLEYKKKGQKRTTRRHISEYGAGTIMMIVLT